MNILLIQPYINASTPILYLNEPIGLISLASYLKANVKTKISINILDLYALGYNRVIKDGGTFNIGISEPEEIIRNVKDYRPDIVGITCNFTTYTKAAFAVVNILKTEFPETIVVVGGAHATMDAENVLTTGCKADIIVRGEGEITFCEIVEKIANKEPWHDLQGLTYRKDGNITSNPRRPLIPDINILPIPDRKYIQQNVYSMINRKMYFLSKGKKVASLMTSRGCPFNCVFCSTKVVWERKFRPRDAQLVIEEMERLISDYYIDEFLINDDQFYLDKKRVHEICDLIVERKWKIHLNVASGSSAWLIDKELLKKLKSAGLYRITFPIESGCQKTLKYIRKPIDLAKTKELIKAANGLGLWTYANIIVGFPYETREDIQETIDYVNRSGLDYATYFIAKPYAGSEMYEDFEAEGLLNGKEIEPTTMGEVGHDIIHLTSKELQEIRDYAQKRYIIYGFSNYFNPMFFHKYFFPKINSPIKFFYFIRTIKDTINTLVICPLKQRLFRYIREFVGTAL